MLKRIGMNKKQLGRELLDVEAFLQSNLRPISARPEFIQSLQKGLMEYTYPQADSDEVDLKKAIIFAFFGFAGLVFVFSLWIRLLLVIISTLGMVQSSKRRRISK
jgi:hypothetical protein